MNLNFKNYGIKKFFVSTYYKSFQIKKYLNNLNLNFDIKYIEEKKPLGTAGCLSLINYSELKKYVLVIKNTIIY